MAHSSHAALGRRHIPTGTASLLEGQISNRRSPAGAGRGRLRAYFSSSAKAIIGALASSNAVANGCSPHQVLGRNASRRGILTHPPLPLDVVTILHPPIRRSIT